MQNPDTSDKLRLIYQLLFDLATGRDRVVIGHKLTNDHYDTIILELTTLRNRLRDLAIHSGMVPPYYAYAPMITLVFVLDASHRIFDFNDTVVLRLRYLPEALRYRVFTEVLTEESLQVWNDRMREAGDGEVNSDIVTLQLVSADGTLLPLCCSITRTLFEDLVFVLAVEVFLKGAAGLKNPESLVTDSMKAEVAAVEALHSYILNHLDEPLPSLKHLALRFGIEVAKLQHGFKAQYRSSIYQFYQDERLKKGYVLITQTNLLLKEIAYQCGYFNYLNFYKAFKKKYGIAPSTLLRP